MIGKSTIEVAQGALEANLAQLRRHLPADAAVLAVIKADAYGHGAALCAPVLAHAGADFLGVTDVAEGMEVRQALQASTAANSTPNTPILVMTGIAPTEAEAQAILAFHLTPTVWLPAQIDVLAKVARQSSLPPVAVHIELDTGMSRQGVRPGDLPALLQRAHGQVRLDGVFTHFASAEVVGAEITARQQKAFHHALTLLEAAGERPAWVHAGNSSTVDDGRLLPWLGEWAARLGARLLARSGLALWGYLLPLQGGVGRLTGLRLVAHWVTRILDIRDLRTGETVGYNATFQAPHPMRLGLLPVGYADGLRRELSGSGCRDGSSGFVVVRGQLCPVVGRVSMNLTVVDLSTLPHILPGEPAQLLGPGWDAADAARCAGTIPYEILCGMRGHRLLTP